MRGYIGVTDNEWFKFLAQQSGIDEVNFWQPGGRSHFKLLHPGEPFFFKLHSPLNYIVGGGFFAHHTILPISIAWESFQEKNGVNSLYEMRQRTEKYRRIKTAPFEDYKIGCIILTQPFFFSRDQWIPIPPDFSLNIVQGKGYDLTHGHGRMLWTQVKERLKVISSNFNNQVKISEPDAKYGEPILVFPRLGQGSFRILVTDAYQRRCAITREKTLPALEAAHIKPFSENGPHSVDNGLLLRSDIHRLFDSGYVTITTQNNFEVSNRIKEEFDNGEQYRRFHGHKIHMPSTIPFRPSSKFLCWHNENVYIG
ncbi:HNH endonuclease [Thermodesulfobacteriota bacterium]